jgi:hypothetical protein
MTLGTVTRALLLLLGGVVFVSLLVIGLWSVEPYNLLRSPCARVPGDCLISITRVTALWGSLYVASLSMGLALLHYDAKYVSIATTSCAVE